MTLSRGDLEAAALPKLDIPYHWVRGKRVPHIRAEIHTDEQGDIGVIRDLREDKIILWCHPQQAWFQELLKNPFPERE